MAAVGDAEAAGAAAGAAEAAAAEQAESDIQWCEYCLACGKRTVAELQCQECLSPDPSILCAACDVALHKPRTKAGHLRAPLVAAGGRFQFSIGAKGRGALQFFGPSGVALADDENALVVVDQTNQRVQAFNAESGDFLWEHGELMQEGDGLREMRFPRGAAFSVDRKFVFVADAGNHRVLVLRGDTGRRVWAWGSPGTGSIQFSYPWGVACWKSRIWVSDWNNHRVQCMHATEGTFIRQVGEPSIGGSAAREMLREPTGVVCFDGRLFVADSRNHRVQVYKEDSGIHLMCIGKGHGAGDGQLDLPMGISIDTSKRLIYVCEGGNRRVSVFSCENYSFRSKFGSSGSGPGEFMKPEGIYVDSARQLVYVTDNYLHRIVVYSTVS